MARYGLNTLQGGGTSQAITTTFKTSLALTAAHGWTSYPRPSDRRSSRPLWPA